MKVRTDNTRTLYNALNKIAELEKENAELKKEVLEVRQHLDLTEREWEKDTTKLIHYKTQLAKAEELLKDITSSYGSTKVSEAQMCLKIKKAEQFLK